MKARITSVRLKSIPPRPLIVNRITHVCPTALLTLVMAASGLAQTPSITVVSAASYQPAVAPASLASLFGSNLASNPMSATLDANGQLPTQLGGVTVYVNGEAAPLIYVGTQQINFVIPADAPMGSVTVNVQTQFGNAGSATVQVNTTAPALFSTNASGSGAGAILNAVTYTPAPFLVTTSANTGGDQRTRLAIYGTGIRYAGNPSLDSSITNIASNITAQASDAFGGTYNLTIEYAGAAPGYFGLDQINVVLPPDLDRTQTVSLLIDTSNASSNTVTFRMNALPSSAIQLAGLSIAPAYVIAGATATGTVSLNGRASSSGVIVALNSSVLAAQPPISLTIPAGSISATFNLNTSFVATSQMATITARANGASQTATLQIDPQSTAQVQTFTVAPTSVQGGGAVLATVMLSLPATSGGGATIALTSDNAAVQPPNTIAVPFGRQTATVSIPTSVVMTQQTATLTATYGQSSVQTKLIVNPAFTLTLAAASVTGGNSIQGTLALAAPSTGNISFTLRSNDSSAQAPVSIIVPTGQGSVSFTVTTSQVSAARTVTFTASSPSFPAFTQTTTLSVNPPAAATLKSISISPSEVKGGQSATGTVTLAAPAPAGGVAVTFRSSSIAAQVSQSVLIVPQGATSATFQITTITVSSSQTASITATAAGISQIATLTVN